MGRGSPIGSEALRVPARVMGSPLPRKLVKSPMPGSQGLAVGPLLSSAAGSIIGDGMDPVEGQRICPLGVISPLRACCLKGEGRAHNVQTLSPLPEVPHSPTDSPAHPGRTLCRT